MKHQPLPVTGQIADTRTMLQIAGCDLWSRKAVRAHKIAELDKINSSGAWRFLRNIHPALVLFPRTLLLTYLFAAGCALTLAHRANDLPSGDLFGLWVFLISGFLFLFASIYNNHNWIVVKATPFPKPMEAVALMHKIEAMVPNARFEVEHIRPDPILLLSTGPWWKPGCIYRQAIYVWDTHNKRVAPPL